MKAIQVKYLPPTNTKPTRLKAFIKGHSLTKSIYELEGRGAILGEADNEWSLVRLFITSLGWVGDVEIIGKGVLPNEDTVFILQSNL